MFIIYHDYKGEVVAVCDTLKSCKKVIKQLIKQEFKKDRDCKFISISDAIGDDPIFIFEVNYKFEKEIHVSEFIVQKFYLNEINALL